MFISDKLSGSFTIFLTAVIYGSYGVWSRLVSESFGVFFQMYVRALLAWLIVVIIVIVFKKWKKIRSTSDTRSLIWIALLGIVTQLFIYSFTKIGIGLASIIYFFSLLITQYIVGYLYFKESITRIRVASFVLALFGIFLIFKNESIAVEILAVLAAIISGVAVALQTSVTKSVSSVYSSMQISVFSWFGIIVFYGFLSNIIGEVQHVPEVNISWFYLLLFSVVGLATYPLFIYGYRRVDMSLGGVIGLMEIPVAMMFGYFLFNEHISIVTGLGAVLIVIAASIEDFSKLLGEKSRRLRIVNNQFDFKEKRL